MLKILAFATSFLFLTSPAFSQKMTDLNKLVETERAFARMAAENSTKEAFLHFLADDGIVFEKGPVNGKEVWSKRPESKGLLSWEPVWADISADGSIGYTTGPWEFRPAGKDGEPVAFGEYVTIWKKQKSGEFRAVLDIGISHGKPEGETPKISFPEDAGVSREVPQFFPEVVKFSLESAAEDVRIYRDSEFPMIGEEGKRELKSDKLFNSSPVACSGSGDLFFCRTVVSNDSHQDRKTGNRVVILRFRDLKWQIVLDLVAETQQ